MVGSSWPRVPPILGQTDSVPSETPVFNLPSTRPYFLLQSRFRVNIINVFWLSVQQQHKWGPTGGHAYKLYIPQKTRVIFDEHFYHVES